MKLLYCNVCHDIFNLTLDKVKSCSCGAVSGRYVSIDTVYYKEKKEGDAIFLGFLNNSFMEARHVWRSDGYTTRGDLEFTAFFIAKNCFSIKKESIF